MTTRGACSPARFSTSASATTIERVGETATATGLLSMFGTPAYMPPEAIECSPNIDRRVDVYGFGVLLFEMLTGNAAFSGRAGNRACLRAS